ncbi:saccharopine dehydrogenase NADP-binding domain-containing protein [Cupriavidus necator]|uniref:saccharopine dehydrogenase NADP-binding domain-containing protein n=1 Tax=Cupriavidus necator TaxID=106590 RepID=UPI000AAC364B|nr:saccharopine dehydrogenase NADP-binding domain-containing protein [Cupriavidus necator]
MEAIDATITASNFEPVLGPMLRPGAFLLNLAPSVCSRDLIALAQARGAFDVDAGIEPWDYEGGQHTSHLSNYALREEMLAFARCRDTQTTALVAHGTNPGLVSVLVKAALMELAGNAGLRQPEPADRAGWAALARALDVRVIQVAEYDCQQASGYPRDGKFANPGPPKGLLPNACRTPSSAGQPRARAAARRLSPPLRQRRGDCAGPARASHARAIVVPGAWALRCVPNHAERIDLDRRVPDRR